MVQLEEPFSIFAIKGFCNEIDDNDHEIIGLGPNKGKNNVDRGTAVTVDGSDVGTGVGSLSEEDV